MQEANISAKIAKGVEEMDVEEYLDFLTRGEDEMLEECPHCGRFLSASHQSVCDKG
jgi:hypothetical protein